MANITAKNIDFSYDTTQILHNVSFDIPSGSITALVGPNGAGKTTLLRCLTGLEKPLNGSISLGDIDVGENPRAAHKLVGYLSDFFGLYDTLTVRQCLTYKAWSHNLRGQEAAQKVESIAAMIGLTDRMEEAAGKLSRGYRQRVGIGLAMIHDPDIIILDEPASGMDPEARISMSKMMHTLNEAGKTLLVSSHILNELEDYCTDMLVIRDGRIAEHVFLKDHRRQKGRRLLIGLNDAGKSHVGHLESSPLIYEIQVEGNKIIAVFKGDDTEQQALLTELVKAGVPINSFSLEDESLSDAYMSIAAGKATGDPS